MLNTVRAHACTITHTGRHRCHELLCPDLITFSAYTTSNQEPDISDLVLFERVLVNTGGGYDESTSIFTCPTTGFYYVYYNLFLRLDHTDYYQCDVQIRMGDFGDVMAEVNLQLASCAVELKMDTKAW